MSSITTKTGASQVPGASAMHTSRHFTFAASVLGVRCTRPQNLGCTYLQYKLTE